MAQVRHELSIHIADIASSEVIKVTDQSVYVAGLPYACPRLSVTMPGCEHPVHVEGDWNAGFDALLDARALGLRTGTQPPVALPDGLYVISYSIAPHELTVVTRLHLKMSQALACYDRTLCSIAADTPAIRLSALRNIRLLFEAARAQAESCGTPRQADRLLRYAISELERFQKQCHR